jgi:hypothetical protein
MKEKKCKICGAGFIPFNSMQKVCGYKCAIEKAKMDREKKEAREWAERKKILSAKIQTKSDVKKKVQKVFNEWVRLRDQDLNCISCRKPAKKAHAGHYLSVGRFPELALDPDNVNLQCDYCNIYLSGNGALYTTGLIEKIGEKRYNELLSRANVPKNYTISDLMYLYNEYKAKVKTLKEKKN